MPKRTDIKSILIIGAGPIVIGLAATGIVRTLVVTTGGVTVQLPLHPLFWNVQAAALLATPDASFSVPG